MATDTQIEALEQKLKAARAEREQDTGGLLAIAPEDVSIQEFTARETALRLADPIAFMAMQRQMMIKAYETLMIKDQDYGKVSGCGDKPMLFKAGAEKAANLFNLSIRVECVKEIENEEKEYFSYTYKATVLNRSGRIISECEGNCNSREKKYRYRWISETYATEDQKKAAVSRKKFDGKNYWSIQVPNHDIYDQLNTLIKMAQKRAIVGAVLIATNSSAFFGNAELESNHGFEVPEDRPTWDAEIVEEHSSKTKSVSDRDWKSILRQIDWPVATLKETALANNLPASSTDLSEEQSDALFEAVLTRLGLESGVFKAFAHCKHSLAKVEATSDAEKIDLWLQKLEAKQTQSEPVPGLE